MLSIETQKLCCLKESFLTIFGSEDMVCSLDIGSSLFNSLGVIPIVGIAIGIIRLMNKPEVNDHFSLEEDKYHNKCLSIFCVLRATLEILGLGLICWIIDKMVNLALWLCSALKL